MKPGEVVVWDDSNNWVERGGTDPTPILGLSEVDSEQARVLTANGKIPIRVIKGSKAVICMCSDTTPVVATHVSTKYGIVRDGTTGFWKVDTSDTSNTRIIVLDVELSPERWYVQFLPAQLLFNAA